MTHPRQSIRDAVVAALIAASTAAGTNVFSSRGDAFGERIPALNVLTGDDRMRDEGILDLATGAIEREVDLVVEAAVAANDDGDDALDDLCREVELALYADRTLGGAALFLMFESSSIRQTEGIKPDGHQADILFTVVYRELWT